MVYLFHGVEFDRAESFLNNGYIPCKSSHYFDGKNRIDSYKDIKERLILGICTTLDLDIAKRFGDVVFIFDRDKLNKHFNLYRVNFYKYIEKDEKEVFVSPYITNSKYDNYQRYVFTQRNRLKIYLSGEYLIGFISNKKHDHPLYLGDTFPNNDAKDII